MDFIGILKEQFTRREMVNDCNLAIFLLWDYSLIKELKHRKGCPSTLRILLLDPAGLVADKTTGCPEILDLCGHWDMVQRWEIIQLSPSYLPALLWSSRPRDWRVWYGRTAIYSNSIFLTVWSITAWFTSFGNEVGQMFCLSGCSHCPFPKLVDSSASFTCAGEISTDCFPFCGQVLVERFLIDFHEQGIWWQYRSSSLMTCSVQDQQKT